MKSRKKKCLNCIQNKNCNETYISWIFFVIALIATVAIRVVTVLTHLNPVYGKIAWYIGIGGFVIFFIYKFRVTQGQARIVREKKILEKINRPAELTVEDCSLIEAVLCSLTSQKDRITYFFIFALSALTLFIALYIDFFKSG